MMPFACAGVAMVSLAATLPAGTQPVVLPQGTVITFTTVTVLNSKHSRAGDGFDLAVATDVKIGDRVVIPIGTPARGKVTFVKKKGGWGKSGRIEASVVSVKVGDADVSVHGVVGDKGKVGTAAVVGTVLLSPLVVAPFMGFLVTGTSAEVPIGSPASATLDVDLPFDGPAAADVQLR